ncbi:MAG: WD40 repeat domain-containing protein [Planctomycetia bacterium]|nr:WD40 repeat domain-containing protein [Planctomycetia bacterium]
MTRLEELLLLWQDQTLTEPQLAEMKQLLASAAGRAKMAEDLFLTGVVLESLRAQGAARQMLAGREVLAGSEEPRAQATPAHHSMFSLGAVQRGQVIGLASAAAVVLVVLGSILWLRPSPTDPLPAATAFAQVEQVHGETFVLSREQRRPVQEGHVLTPGQGIATQGEASEAVVQMENSVRLTLGGDTTVFTTTETEAPRATGPKVVLEQGDLLVEVTRSLKRKQMTVATPIGVAVTETEDAALHISDAAGIVVVRGEINFTHRPTGQSIRIKAGQYLAGTQQGELYTSQFYSGHGHVWTTFPRSGLGVNALGYALAFAPDGQSLAAASRASESGVRFGPVDGEEAPQERPGRLGVGVSPAGMPGLPLLATIDHGNVLLYELTTGKQHAVLKGDRRIPPTCLAFSPDGKTLAVGRGTGRDTAGVVEMWQLDTGTLRATYRGHAAGVTALAFSLDSKFLATGSLDKTVVLWDTATGQERTRSLMSPPSVVWSVAFAPDGKTLAVATGPDDFRLRQPGDIKLWDIATETVRTTLRGHSRAATSIVFSPDGQSLISGSADTTVRFWDTSTGREYGMLKGHQAAPGFEALTVALSPDGKWLATASFDRTVKVWKTTWNRNEGGIRILTAQSKPKMPWHDVWPC